MKSKLKKYWDQLRQWYRYWKGELACITVYAWDDGDKVKKVIHEEYRETEEFLKKAEFTVNFSPSSHRYCQVVVHTSPYARFDSFSMMAMENTVTERKDDDGHRSV